MKLKTRLAIAILTIVTTFLFGIFITRPVKVFLKSRLQPSPWQVLLRFENQDLEGLDRQSSSTVKRASQQLTGKVDEDFFWPRLFRTITNTSGEKRYILVEEKPMMIIPGETRLRVHIFDTAGNLLDVEEFSAGYRVSLSSLYIREVYFLNREALVVNGDTVFGGQLVYQVYSLIGNQMALVHLSSGVIIDFNNYPVWEIGPKTRRSVDEWEKLLMSGDQAEFRAALVWLNGGNGSDETQVEFKDLRSRETVRTRLAELSQADDPWVKAMAESAAKNE